MESRLSRLSIGGGRFYAAAACFLLIPLAMAVPAIIALAVLAVIWSALHAYELIWWHEARAELRAQRLPLSAG